MIADFLIALLVTLAVHEAGHAAAATAFRLPWKPVLTRHGPGVMIGNDDIRLTRFQVAVTSAAGPLANLVLAYMAVKTGMAVLALLNIEFAYFNLIPFKRSDGHRIVYGQQLDQRSETALRS